MTQTWRNVLAVHPAAEDYPMISEAEIAALAEDIKTKGLEHRVTLWRDGSVLDGRNRLDALERNGAKLFDEAGEPSPTYFAFDPGIPGASAKGRVASLNLHRRHLTDDQKRIIVAKLLREHPEKSDRAVAKEAKVDHKVASRVRKKLEAKGTITPQATVAGKPGVVQRRKKAKKTPTVNETAPKQNAVKRESKSAEWGRLCDEAVASLERMEEMRQEWADIYDNMNEGLQQSPYGLKLEAMQSLDLESALSAVQEAQGLDVPRGFGRD